MKKYEKAEEKRKREAEEKRRYLEGIKRFQKVGVTVLVDGKEPGPQDLEKIVEIREDGEIFLTGDVGYVGSISLGSYFTEQLKLV